MQRNVNNNSQSRIVLGDYLPLATPLSVHIFPSYYCNFKCSYCLQCMDNEKLKSMAFKRQFMDFSTYTKCIDNLTRFSEKLKALIFAGHGEPLVHHRIADMIAYAKERDVSERVEIVTNGYLLTQELGDSLISANLDRLRVSVQGIDAQAYKKMTGVIIDFDRLVNQLEYFYRHKKNTAVHIKIVDVALKNQDEADRFLEIFKPCCDEISVEYLIPFIPDLDLSGLKTNFDHSRFGNETSATEICSMPFYMLVLEPDGNLVPCCSAIPPLKLGSILTDEMLAIWNGEPMRQFQKLQLNRRRIENPICKECTVPHFALQRGDYLDNYAKTILEKI